MMIFQILYINLRSLKTQSDDRCQAETLHTNILNQKSNKNVCLKECIDKREKGYIDRAMNKVKSPGLIHKL